MLLDFHLFHAYICILFYYKINYRSLAKTHEQKIRSILLDIVSITYDIEINFMKGPRKAILSVRICILSSRSCILSTRVCLKYINLKTDQSLGRRNTALKNMGLE